MSADRLGRAPLGGRERLYALAAVAVAALAVALVAFGGLGRNLVYSWGPSELREAGPRAVGATVRLGGLVADGTLRREPDGVAFTVSDGRQTVPVRSAGLPPQMLREGIAVVVEGRLGGDGVFEGTRLMVSHGNEYRAQAGAEGRPGR